MPRSDNTVFMRYLCSFFTVFYVFFFQQFAFGAVAIVEPLQKKYEKIAAMQASFTQVLVHKESGSREQRTGVLYYKKDLRVRWEVKHPSPELLVVNKDAIWDAFPDEEMVYKYPPEMAQDSRSIVRVITGQARLDQDFHLEEGKKEDGLTVVRLYPKDPVQSLVEALLWIDPGTLLIKKVRVYDFYGNENEITFSNLNIAASLADTLFSYTPPKGFVVEDRGRGENKVPQKALLQ